MRGRGPGRGSGRGRGRGREGKAIVTVIDSQKNGDLAKVILRMVFWFLSSKTNMRCS